MQTIKNPKSDEPQDSFKIVLPRLLHVYESADFGVQQRARFLYNICWLAIFAMICVIFTTSYVQLISTETQSIYLPIIFSELAVIVLVVFCLVLLIKGMYYWSSMIFISGALLCVWIVMWIDHGEPILRLDTIVILVALFNLMPLFIIRFNRTIISYIVINLVILFLFVFKTHSEIDLTRAEIIDYLVDNSLAIIFTGIVGYAVFGINKKVLDKALLEIKERKRATEIIEERESVMAGLLNGIPLPTFMIDSQGTLLYLNDALAMDYHSTVQDMLGTNAYAMLPPDLAKLRKSIIDKVFETGKPSTLNDSNKGRYFTNYFYPVLDSNRKTSSVVIFALDITDLNFAEKSLRDSEELFKSLIRHAPYPTVLTDMGNRFIIVNDAFIETVGKPESDIIGKTPDEVDFSFDEDSLKHIKTKLDLFGKADDVEVTIPGVDSNELQYLFSSRIIRWKEQPHFLNIYVNITYLKNLERELQKHRNSLELLVKERTEELAAANDLLFLQREELQSTLDQLRNAQQQLVQSEKMASLGVLSAGIAHEINNPLNFIHGGINGIELYLAEKLPEHLPELEVLIQAVREGVKRSANIVTSLNHYSRQNDLTMTECFPHEMIDNCLIILNNRLKDRITVEKHYTSSNCAIFGNEGKLHQVFLNVLSNAEQAIETDGLIKISTHIEQQSLIIKIEDSGTGIEKKNLDKVFDPFFTTKSPGKGTGLGLSISYNIIIEHNGSLIIDSVPGEGTTAIIKLPLKIPE